MAGRVHYPLLLMLQFFFTNLTFLSGKISGDTQGVIQHPSGDVYYLEFFNLDIDTVTKNNVWSRQILEPNLIHILCTAYYGTVCKLPYSYSEFMENTKH